MKDKFYLFQSTMQNKRYMIVTEDNKRVHFGSPYHENYNIHQNEIRKNRYIKRHMKREDWTDADTPGFWSRWLLWNQKGLYESIRDTEKRFNIKIVF
jgi:hypothetical protein